MNQTPQTKVYTARINRVLDHIDTHIDQELSLERLAGVANFSKFHFHRIFKAMVGETLNFYIQRIRAEKSASQLINNPKKSITAIALDCGFSGSAAFARAFKEFYGMSASQWRDQLEQNSKIGKTIGKIRKEISPSPVYSCLQLSNQQQWRVTMTKDGNKNEAQVEVKEMPDHHVAYVRNIGPYKGDSSLFEGLFSKLMAWAGPRGILCTEGQQVMAVYHDDPNITREDKLRLSACITVPEDTSIEGEVGKMTVAGGLFAVGHFELADASEYEGAWDSLMGGWMPNSGYQPDDRLCYELYHNDPNEHPEGKHIVDICVPVKPL